MSRPGVRVLFVCMGNICRSPTAQGVFEKLVRDAGLQDRIDIDSAGTHAYHVGEQPDRRSQATARGRGIDLSTQRARRVNGNDFGMFDYVLAMDSDNHEILTDACPPEYRDRLFRFLEFAPELGRDVPDPYYGGPQGFENVFDMVETAGRNLLAHIRERHGL
ncbi:MAG: low molecular weight phosphotyrosine protein phosphatase [Gammaproteobacteria bacterium]|nr:low molecular weight phosphotyrosine protein phosphatase [Gammaproteobacteria bacterium]